MSRIEQLKKRINTIIENLDDAEIRSKAFIHSYGVAQAAALLAIKRGLDPELAAVAGILHDIYAYVAGSYENHDIKGAELAREILNDINLFSNDEIEIVCTAIFNHDDRQGKHSPYDEILKDADILQPYLYQLTEPLSPPAKKRLSEMFLELTL